MFQKKVTLLTLSVVLLLLLKTRKSFGLVSPLYTEYYANYHNHPGDDEQILNYNIFLSLGTTHAKIPHTSSISTQSPSCVLTQSTSTSTQRIGVGRLLTFNLNYKFHYFIDHAPSKVHMMHLEERQGDKVRGQYGLLEPNGMVRMVHYQVAGDGGFQSVVQTRTPHSTTHVRLRNRNQPKLPVMLKPPVAAVI